MYRKGINTLVISSILCVFIFLKWSSLSLPYFWDEAWSYIPALSQMANGIPCLWPGCIDTELYRGHPLFFYFLTSIWMKLVGDSLFSMHFFSLVISILAILSFYRLSCSIVSSKWSLLGVVMLMLQETFYVQSSFVLPEVLLMLLTTETIWSYISGRKIYFLLAAGLLGLTKETGLVILSGFILFHFINVREIKVKSFWIVLSILPAVAFYSIQKIKYGWFFFPLHLDLTDISINTLKSKSELIFKFLFLEQGRKIILIILVCVAIFNNFFERSKKYYFIYAALIILIMYMFFTNNVLITSILLGLLIAYFLKTFSYTYIENKFILLSTIIFMLFFIFSISNFLMLRYLLLMFPFIILWALILLKKSVPKSKLSYAGIFALLTISFSNSIVNNYKNKNWHDDASINYINIVKVHQKVVQYCEQNNWQDKRIFTHFLLHHNLLKPELGYLTSSAFKYVNHEGEMKSNDEIVILSCIEYDERQHRMVANNPQYKLAKRFELQKAWSEIYIYQAN